MENILPYAFAGLLGLAVFMQLFGTILLKWLFPSVFNPAPQVSEAPSKAVQHSSDLVDDEIDRLADVRHEASMRNAAAAQAAAAATLVAAASSDSDGPLPEIPALAGIPVLTDVLTAKELAANSLPPSVEDDGYPPLHDFEPDDGLMA